jgi:NAD(P)-dependent dehydrogenase (short-subunit alcohol dehydrogenase family)
LRQITEHLAASEERLDVLINNAGTSLQADLSDYPDSAFPQSSEINIAAPFHLIRELLPLLRAGATESNPSKVINIGSVSAINFRLFNNFAYTASKAGLHAVSRQLAIALARDHITVNVIAPGPFRTEMMDNMIRDQGLETIVRRVPMHRLGEHDDVVGAAVYLASHAGNFVTASILRVDGGVSNVSA